jgi:CheY-like chemotaxis protein
VIPENRLNILLVEDNEDDRFLALRLLRKLPLEMEIAVAKNGDEALHLLLGEDAAIPDIVLLDLQLPKIGGVQLLSRLREKYGAKELPVIVLSSSDNPGDIRLCGELGISGYLFKPLNPAPLLSLIQETRPDLSCMT